MQMDRRLQLGVGYRSDVNIIGYGEQVQFIGIEDVLGLFVRAICDTDYGRWNNTPDVLAMRILCKTCKRVVDMYATVAYYGRVGPWIQTKAIAMRRQTATQGAPDTLSIHIPPALPAPLPHEYGTSAQESMWHEVAAASINGHSEIVMEHATYWAWLWATDESIWGRSMYMYDSDDDSDSDDDDSDSDGDDSSSDHDVDDDVALWHAGFQWIERGADQHESTMTQTFSQNMAMSMMHEQIDVMTDDRHVRITYEGAVQGSFGFSGTIAHERDHVSYVPYQIDVRSYAKDHETNVLVRPCAALGELNVAHP